MRTLFIVNLILLNLCSIAQKGAIFSTKDGAIHGYDPVAYFVEQAPVKGNEKYSLVWEGAVWYFASEENKERFEVNPEKYTPQYGGYCAYAVANGYTAKTDPTAWSIVDDRLFLNYNKSIQKKWDNNREAFIDQADKNWQSIKSN